MRSHLTPYETSFAGLPLLVLPGVWSPAYDWSSSFYVDNLPALAQRDVLEIGSGCGVLSVFASRLGAKSVVAVDINPAAVQNTLANFSRFGIRDARAFRSDCFENVSGTFDTVIWNAPFHGAPAADLLERACADPDYAGVRAFFRSVDAHLRDGGNILFGFSESGDLALVERLISGSGFKVVRRLSEWRQGYNCILFELERAPGRAAARESAGVEPT